MKTKDKTETVNNTQSIFQLSDSKIKISKVGASTIVEII